VALGLRTFLRLRPGGGERLRIHLPGVGVRREWDVAELSALRGRLTGGANTGPALRAVRHCAECTERWWCPIPADSHGQGMGCEHCWSCGCLCALQAVRTDGLWGSLPPQTGLCNTSVALKTYRVLCLLLFYRSHWTSGKDSSPFGVGGPWNTPQGSVIGIELARTQQGSEQSSQTCSGFRVVLREARSWAG